MMPIFYISQVCTIELFLELCSKLSMMTITSNHAWSMIKVTFYSHGWWFITKCGNVQHTFLEILLNKHICHRKSIVKNSFGILKIYFWNLLMKINLHVLFFVDMVICCCVLYDMILNNKDLNIDAFMLQLEIEIVQTMVTLFLGKENNEFLWNLQILTTKKNRNTRSKNIKD